MKTEAYSVSLDALIALASRQKRPITRAWIIKYQRLGLLPPQKKPGLGRGKGKPSHYTQELANQMVPLIIALKVRGKNLDAVGWDLWWHGWYADVRYWREPLLHSAKIFDLVRAGLTPVNEDDDRPFELLRAIGDQVGSARSNHRVIGAAKRYRDGGVTDLLSLVMGVLSGSYVPFKDYAHSADNHELKESENLLARALTIPAADADIPGNNSHFPISVEALDGMFSTLSGQFNIDIETFVRHLPEQEVVQARKQIALFMHVIGQVEEQSLTISRRSTGAKTIFWARRNQKQQLGYLIGWLVLRRDKQFKRNTDDFALNLKRQIGLPVGA